MSTPTSSRAVYPIMLDVADRRIVIIGGGAVAARKAAGVLAAAATRVYCVAPAFAEGMPAAVERVHERYAPHHLNGAGLVFAATDDAGVNAAVVADAKARGIWVNRADVPEAEGDSPGDFTVPARLDDGPVTLTVSAGSPALAVLIREGIARAWDPRWTQMAEVMRSLRPAIVRSKRLDAGQRRAAFRDLATPEALDILGVGGLDALTKWLRQRYPEME